MSVTYPTSDPDASNSPAGPRKQRGGKLAIESNQWISVNEHQFVYHPVQRIATPVGRSVLDGPDQTALVERI